MIQDLRPSLADLALGLAYFLAATAAILFTRFDGGIAFLWIASPLLIAVLMVRPRRRWVGAFLTCTIGSILATGIFGLGWSLALPFAVINMVDDAAKRAAARAAARQALAASSRLTRVVLTRMTASDPVIEVITA